MDVMASISGVGARTGQAAFQLLGNSVTAPQSDPTTGDISMSALKLIESAVANSPAAPAHDFDIRA